MLADELPLLAQELFGLLTRVTSLAYLGFERELDERCAERLDLFLDRGTDVIRRDDRAKAPRGGDRLEAGNARAHDQHAGRRDRAGGRHHHRKELADSVGGHQDRLVAGR